MDDVKWTDRIRYQVDNTFSKGTGALIAWLGILSVVVISIAAVLVVITGAAMEGESSPSFIEAFWLSLMRTLDAGTMGGDTGWGFRLIMFAVTLGGVFIISTLIGVLTSGVESKLEDLRKGRSRVIENGHTAILGWSEQVFTIISELVVANENLPRSCIVVLGNKDKVEMEDEIQEKVGNTGRTKVVCRSGSPMEMEDLAIASLNAAKSIIVLSPEHENADADVIKTVLAITNYPKRKSDPYHIVAELRNPKNNEIAKVVGKDEVEWLQVGDLVARVIAQTCRQSGLSVVYTELLDFGGDEIYFTEEKQLYGKTYGDALKMYEKNTVMGISEKPGMAALNPPMETILQPGTRMVIIAEDDDKIFFNPTPGAFEADKIVDSKAYKPVAERTIILGWNWRGCKILEELDNYVPSGSEVLVVSEQEGFEKDLRACKRNLKNQKLESREGDITDRSTLEELELDKFDHIILLSYADIMDVQQADARTLVCLLHLRDISEKKNIDMSIVSEMLDVRNRNLAEVTRADDFIVSDKLVSLMITQVSENKGLNAVFTDMFDPEGSEIYVKPAGLYVKTGQPVNFYTVLEAARRRGETAIGYRLERYGHDADKAYGVNLNPAKSESITFAEEDKVVVLAND